MLFRSLARGDLPPAVAANNVAYMRSIATAELSVSDLAAPAARSSLTPAAKPPLPQPKPVTVSEAPMPKPVAAAPVAAPAPVAASTPTPAPASASGAPKPLAPASVSAESDRAATAND